MASLSAKGSELERWMAGNVSPTAARVSMSQVLLPLGSPLTNSSITSLTGTHIILCGGTLAQSGLITGILATPSDPLTPIVEPIVIRK
jgi:hypothetical protein